jgi:hypothetical protein
MLKRGHVQDLLEDFLIPDPQHLSSLLGRGMPPRFQRLSEQMAGLVDQYSMVCPFCYIAKCRRVEI